MSNRALKVLLLLAVLLPGADVTAKEPSQLANNPFARPPSAASSSLRPTVNSDGSVRPLDLRATLVGAKNGLANVSGKLLQPGDEEQGYTLLQIFEDRAIFLKDGKRLTVYVKPELVKSDD